VLGGTQRANLIVGGPLCALKAADDIRREVNEMLGQPEKRPLRQLKLDLDELAFAFENWRYEHQYYLDLETGEVVMVTDEIRRELEDIYEELSHEGDEEATRFMEALQKRDLHDWQKEALAVADQVERGFGTRCIRVPAIELHEAYGDMEDFINTVRSERLQERLWHAIRGRGAFRRFKDVLSGYQRERERWFRFKDDQMRRRVIEWLEGEGIQSVEQED
jgi:Uncharacterised protein family (UPF0158)